MSVSKLFAGGVDGVAASGPSYKLTFAGTWSNVTDWYSLLLASTQGNIDLGTGAFNNLDITACFTYKNRVYIAATSRFLASDNDDPTAWETQDTGSTFIEFLSQYGYQDSIVVFSQLQGRLVVFGAKSIQIWNIDADPQNFGLVQVLDNAGTTASLSVQSIGDLDVVYLDETGFRSLLAKQTTLNADVDDIGTAIDALVQAAISNYDWSASCGIVDPATKAYWCFVKDTIYVLSRHRSSKISAWATFVPTDDAGVTFTPKKFVVYNKRVYCRGSRDSYTHALICYGGSGGNTYDSSVATMQTPWLDDKTPATLKQLEAINVVAKGKWTLSVASDPQSSTFTDVRIDGSPTSPSGLTDSSYDTGRTPISMRGTHFTVKAVSDSTNTGEAKMSALVLHYNKCEAL